MNHYLTRHALKTALRKVKTKKDPWPDGVTNEMFIHLGSPTLFLICKNDLVSDLPRGVQSALYVDDLLQWFKEEQATTA